MPINTTGVPTNFLPMFTPSGNLASDMRKIEIAKSISFAWLKGQFYSNMKKAGSVINISGKEYFGPTYIRGNSYGFFTYNTKGYWIAESLRLLGYDDDSLRKLADASNGDLDNITWVWRRSKTPNATDFSFYANKLREEIANVDSIKIEYELDRYKNTVYTTEASRIYTPKTSGMNWAQGCIPNPSIYKWTMMEAYPATTPNVIHKEDMYVWGKIKLFSLGVDVTANYSTVIKNALTAMIAYSGESFMHRTSSAKIGERTYTVYSQADDYGGYQASDTFISAIGEETFDAIIKPEFINDTSEIYWKNYSAYYDAETGAVLNADNRYSREPLTRVSAKLSDKWSTINSYSTFFWEIMGYEYNDESITQTDKIDSGDEFLFREYDRMTAVMSVEEFFKLDIKEFTFYFGKYFTFDVNYNNGTFVDMVLAGIGKLFNFVLGTIFDIFYTIPGLRQMLQINAWIVNTAFNTDLTEEEVFKINVQVGIIVASLGSSTATISAGQASATTASATAGASGTALTASEQVAIATANTSSLVTASATIASAFGASFSSSMAFATYVNVASSAYKIYEAMENIDKFDEAKETEEQRSKQAILDEAKAKQKEKDDLQEQLQQRIQEGEQREHQNFLSNPLYIMDNEFKLGVNSIDSEMNKQFNLI